MIFDIENKLDENFYKQDVFKTIELISSFYELLSDSVLSKLTPGINTFWNFNVFFFSSIGETIDSINIILKKLRINDAYSLLRKYYDIITLNVYVNLIYTEKLEQKIAEVNNWINNTKQIDYRKIRKYIYQSTKLSSLKKIVYNNNYDIFYQKIRNRCNDNIHYNYYKNLLQNDGSLIINIANEYLTLFKSDIENLFVWHFAHLYFLTEHYFSSSDYIDYLELGLKPPENSQYWIAPFVQNIFNKIVKTKRPDVASFLIANTKMDIK